MDTVLCIEVVGEIQLPFAKMLGNTGCYQSMSIRVALQCMCSPSALGWDHDTVASFRQSHKGVCFLPPLKTAANLVLHQTVERIHVGKKYGDIPRGIFVVRGENVVLLGEIVSNPLVCRCAGPRAPLLPGIVVCYSEQHCQQT